MCSRSLTFTAPAMKSTPATHKPLLTLSNTNFNEFEAAFDEGADAPGLVLLLSPT
jgi:hypothetical protein